MKLVELLETKPLYYTAIDHERVKTAFNFINQYVQIPKVIQIIGTNGKGSTGRFMAHLMNKSGLNVGHYTSPHILKFNERFWLNGENSSDEMLEIAHQKIYTLMPTNMSAELSYFEYTTLLGLFVFEKCDYVILEAGMGGEYDATNVIPKIASIVTPIDIDHQAFLGNSVSTIATTKLNSIDKIAIIALQPHNEVVDIAQSISKQKGTRLIFVENFKIKNEILLIAEQKAWGIFLIQNAMSACVALDVLEINYDINSLSDWHMDGRYFLYAPNVHIDVGHNLLAAHAIYDTISKPVTLIYNSFDDKPYAEILKLLKTKIKKVLIIEIDNIRALHKNKLTKTLDELYIEYANFDSVIKKDEEYLVFGSFSVVEAFLKSKVFFEK